MALHSHTLVSRSSSERETVGYILVENFSGGVDRTRPRYAIPPGTLYEGINGHLTRGGDFEKRKAFTEFMTLPSGTVSLAKSGGQLVVFGSDVRPPSLDASIAYQRLQHPTVPAATLTKVQSSDLFTGQVYAIGKFSNGDVRHYYNAAHVADWGAGGVNPAGYGSIAKTFGRKLYSPVGSVLWFSQLDTPTNFDTLASGSGFQDMANQLTGSEEVTAMSVYQNLLAIFSREVLQLWSMATDPADNSPVQTIYEFGTRSPRSVLSYGDMDTFFLSDVGIRSLRARTGTNTASINDVGTPIDTLVTDWIAQQTDETVENAIAIVEPVEGRVWMVIGSRIFVFSYFPSKKISGWTWYEPGVSFTDMVTLDRRIYARAGDKIYLYGGANNDTYGDDYDVTAALPYLSGGKPGTYKQIKGFDIAANGEWQCKLLVNPEDVNDFIDIGTLSGNTFIQEDIGAVGHSTYVAPLFTHRGSGAASISQFAIHNDAAEAGS